MRHTKHLWRAGFLLLLLPLGYLVLRQAMYPSSFGMTGFYRFDNLAEQRERPVVHSPVEACAACHPGQAEARQKGSHRTVNCQVCHAPMAVHVREGRRVAAMPLPEVPGTCLKCHRALQARPKGFPQIELGPHLREQGLELAEGVCITCHDAHSPSMGN